MLFTAVWLICVWRKRKKRESRGVDSEVDEAEGRGNGDARIGLVAGCPAIPCF